MLCFFPIENEVLLNKYRRKIKNIPFLIALMELSKSTQLIYPKDELQKVVETMGSVTFPPDFWEELRTEVQSTDDLNRNHNLLQKLT